MFNTTKNKKNDFYKRMLIKKQSPPAKNYI